MTAKTNQPTRISNGQRAKRNAESKNGNREHATLGAGASNPKDPKVGHRSGLPGRGGGQRTPLVERHQRASAMQGRARAFGTAEEQLRRVVEALPVAMLVMGNGGHISASNPLAQALLGYEQDELVPAPFGVVNRYRAGPDESSRPYAIHLRRRPRNPTVPRRA